MAEDKIWILLGKKESGEASAEELAELEMMLKARQDISFSQMLISKIWKTRLRSTPNRESENVVWVRLARKIESSREGVLARRGEIWKKLAVAATIVVILGAGLLLYLKPDTLPREELAKKQNNINQISTQPNLKTKIKLPDGTHVWLNENSQLLYDGKDFGRVNREIVLKGEAFFDVTKNDDVPFIIHAGSIDIRVKGTAFNVKAYPKDKTIETSLIRGAIEVTFPNDPGRTILMKPDEKIVIPVETSGTIPHIDSTLYTVTRLKKNSAGSIPETSWMKGRLAFDDETFEDLAKKMETWYGMKFHFQSDSVRQIKFSGVIDKETIDEALQVMQLSRHFTYRINGNDVWIEK